MIIKLFTFYNINLLIIIIVGVVYDSVVFAKIMLQQVTYCTCEDQIYNSHQKI